MEWTPNKQFNPFNSMKLLAHVPRWSMIRRGKRISPPILVTIDPTNVCNLKCVWCNSKEIHDTVPKNMSNDFLLAIPDMLFRWHVDAVCIAGGGEPLLHPKIDALIELLVSKGIRVGIVTNGTKIFTHVDALSQCDWVGVSVDAASGGTYGEIKQCESTRFKDDVIDGIAALVSYAKSRSCNLGFDSPAYGVTYKFLVHSSNISEIQRAAEIAKQIGCSNVHFRPAGIPWFDLAKNDDPQRLIFATDEIEQFYGEMKAAQRFDDDTFGVYGITHKFDHSFKPAKPFKTCHAIFMTAVLQPGTDFGIDLGLCCDRRGDDRLILKKNIANVDFIPTYWGSEDHWRIYDQINLADCPRCTYKPHNEIFEQVILRDAMTWKFI